MEISFALGRTMSQDWIKNPAITLDAAVLDMLLWRCWIRSGGVHGPAGTAAAGPRGLHGAGSRPGPPLAGRRARVRVPLLPRPVPARRQRVDDHPPERPPPG